MSSCNRLHIKHGKAELTPGLCCLSIFDSIMESYTKCNGKRTWICKSMGMSTYHNLLLDFYGENNVRVTEMFDKLKVDNPGDYD